MKIKSMPAPGKFLRTIFQAVVLSVSMVTLVACGGGGGGGGDTAPPGGSNQTITANGGTVSSLDGIAKVVVPAGAVTNPVTVVLNPAPGETGPADVGLASGSVYEISGDGGSLSLDAEITIDVPVAVPATPAIVSGVYTQPVPITGPLCIDSNNDSKIDYLDVLGALGGGSCFSPPKIGKITPSAVLALTNCKNNLLNVKCPINNLSPGKFGVLLDNEAPKVLEVVMLQKSVTAPGSVIMAVRASDNLGLKQVDLIEQKIVNNVVVSNSVIASYIMSSSPAQKLVTVDTSRNFTSAADNATYRYLGWAVDLNGNQTLQIPLGTDNDVVVNIPAVPPPDSTPPTVSLISSASTVQVGQSIMLTAEATDNVGVTVVEFYRNAVKIGEDTTAPYTLTTTAFTVANLGTQSFTALAKDAAGNSASSTAVPVNVVDTQAPTISLVASATNVNVGNTVTLTATANDNVGVTVVEFFRNGVKIGEDTTAPYQFTTAAFVAADIGTLSFTAKASDAATNSTTSTAVNVTVSAAAPLAAYVNPVTGLDTNAGTSGAPFKTLNKAFTTVGAGGVVWLQDGEFTATTENLGATPVSTGRTVPSGVSINAVNNGGPTLSFTLQFPNGGSITGVDFNVSSSGRMLASGGTLVISGPRWKKLGTVNLTYGIEASGSANVLLDTNGNPNHNYVLTAGGITGFALVTGTAKLTVNGGVIDGSTGQGSGQGGVFFLDNTAQLTLTNLQITNTTGVWSGGGGAIYAFGSPGNKVTLSNTTIDLTGTLATICILADRNIAGVVNAHDITLQNSKLTHCTGGGFQLREGTGLLTLTNSEISNAGRYGIEVGQIGFDSSVNSFGAWTLVLNNATIANNFSGGVYFNNGGQLTLNGGSIAGGTKPGVQMLNNGASGVKNYMLSAQGTTISGNDALVLQGDTASVFTLGTKVQPGGNTLLSTTTGLRMSVAANVLVNAVGNTWNANTQGSDANGKYSLSSSVCSGAVPCDVTSGAGGNYTFTNAGANAKLRLAE